jgi:hypothetical protein
MESQKIRVLLVEDDGRDDLPSCRMLHTIPKSQVELDWTANEAKAPQSRSDAPKGAARL